VKGTPLHISAMINANSDVSSETVADTNRVPEVGEPESQVRGCFGGDGYGIRSHCFQSSVDGLLDQGDKFMHIFRFQVKLQPLQRSSRSHEHQIDS